MRGRELCVVDSERVDQIVGNRWTLGRNRRVDNRLVTGCMCVCLGLKERETGTKREEGQREKEKERV